MGATRLDDHARRSGIRRRTNRGDSGDRFDDVFGAEAETARRVVDAALEAWERAIVDLNPPRGLSNTLEVNVRMMRNGTGFNGSGAVDRWNVGTDSPREGSIRIGRGDDLDGDTLGDGGRWFLDPTPNESSEFLGNIVNAFAGDAQPGSDAIAQFDLFTVVALEMAHVLGLLERAPGLDRVRYSEYVTDTRVPDNAEGNGVGTFWVWDSPSVDGLMTSFNSGNGGENVGAPIHTAGLVDSDGDGSPDAPASVTFEGKTYFGSEDVGNAIYEGSRRYLPSNLVALMLGDAYHYGVVEPELFGTFYTHLGADGLLLMRGGSGASVNTFRIIEVPESGSFARTWTWVTTCPARNRSTLFTVVSIPVVPAHRLRARRRRPDPDAARSVPDHASHRPECQPGPRGTPAPNHGPPHPGEHQRRHRFAQSDCEKSRHGPRPGVPRGGWVRLPDSRRSQLHGRSPL